MKKPGPQDHSRRLLAILPVLLASLFVLPTNAGADATIEGPPIFSSAPGLPDGRVYEQVSPADKNGNEAGATTHSFSTGGEQHYAFAAADGDSVLFEGTGALGEDPAAINSFFVATKNDSAVGWTTRAIAPRPLEPVAQLEGSVNKLQYVDPSPDLSHVMFEASKGTYALNMPSDCTTGAGNGEYQAPYGYQMYLAGSDPFVPATWLERPAIAEPVEVCVASGEAGAPVGGTPNFSTVYFTYPGTLLPEDASRAPHANGQIQSEPRVDVEAWGFYEDRQGVLREAGVLPDGSLNPYGAVPAASGDGKALGGNQISASGERAFFVSPDPLSCEQNGTVLPGHNDCSANPPELYVRENGERTQLVSRDVLLPEASGLPAAAPGGAAEMANPTSQENRQAFVREGSGSYVFASPDGSQAFFQSKDALTKPAAEASSGKEAKTYDFDVDTGTLTYLPSVAGQIVETDTDGSSFAFVRPASGASPAELDLWSAGPDGGSVTPITQLPGEGVWEARMSSDGSELVFITSSTLPGGFNSGGFKQIYRYDASANTLGCVSCPPHGVVPAGNASMGSLHWSEENPTETHDLELRGMRDEHGISADGDRIFFDTPDPLVPQDSNTDTTREEYNADGPEFVKQGRDVYEWENGVVYLISSGKSSLDSYFLDNSESGDDVFFATAENLVPGDTDGAYDVYDARVPRPGDNPAPAAVPCEGSVCQGPPRVQSPLAAPPRATLPGSDNLTAAPMTPAIKPKPTPTAKKCKKGQIRKKNRCVKRPKAKRSAKGKR